MRNKHIGLVKNALETLSAVSIEKIFLNIYNRLMENFDIEIWLQEFTRKLFDEFSSRVKFVGLQGSCKRGEFTEDSDVDLLVVLDKLSFDDLEQYKMIVHSMPFYEKADGIICGQNEIYNCPKFQLFHLVYDTLPLHGNLLTLIPKFSREDVLSSVKINAANLFNEICHGYIYENNDVNVLKQGYKKTFFILQTLHFLKNNVYVGSKKELVLELAGEDKEILLILMNWNSLDVEDNTEFYFEKLLSWIKKRI